MLQRNSLSSFFFLFASLHQFICCIFLFWWSLPTSTLQSHCDCCAKWVSADNTGKLLGKFCITRLRHIRIGSAVGCRCKTVRHPLVSMLPKYQHWESHEMASSLTSMAQDGDMCCGEGREILLVSVTTEAVHLAVWRGHQTPAKPLGPGTIIT